MRSPPDSIRKFISYDPETGVFRWIISPNGQTKVGQIAGTISATGYRRIKFSRERYSAGPLAWWFVYGEWPQTQIDHQDRDRDNNKINNLRCATGSQNMQNGVARQHNNSGFKGVYFHKHKAKWCATIGVNYRHIFLGYYDKPEDAASAYDTAARELFGEFSRINVLC